ncbi:MAG: general stress protein [Corynebacterium sp.]|nr:general stress protein [Corynebacterium sp.]
MSTPFSVTPASATPTGGRGLRTPPQGWPVGSFATYEEAQAAVDYLSDEQFPVSEVTIVGVDLMQVERVHGRLTWGRVLGMGAASGAWMGLFIGIVLGIFSPTLFGPLALGIGVGIIFGVVGSAIGYWATHGTRDFTSTTEIVASRYDVLADPANARRARDLIASRSASSPHPAAPSGTVTSERE